jgi:ornithine cyclodeaminase/alanine dehydrogenase
MKIITYNDILRLNIDNLTLYDWVSEMILEKEKAILPPKISMKPREGVFCNVMPSFVKGWGGVKIVSRYPERIPSLDSQIILFDEASGNFLALMDGNWITAMRTGAVAVHSVKLFAKSDFSDIGIIGLGNTARATLSVLLSVFKGRRFTIRLYEYKDQHIEFAKRFSKEANISFEFCKDYSEVVSQSDVVISCATYLPNDICSNECFREGVLVIPVHTLGFTNCDLFFDKVFADDYGHVKHFKNFQLFHSFAEVHDVVAGMRPGRENDYERILAYNIGIAMHDIYFASEIYKMLENDTTKLVDLEPPKEKFWV